MSTIATPAKLNLGLHVLRRRTDGFHDLATVFYPVGWSDVLHVRAAREISMTCTDGSLPLDGQNLVIRAARDLAETYGVESGAALHLEKMLPTGAGLGGGSSNAAATLRLLCDYWELGCEEEMLVSLALKLGSDVPFFLHPQVAHAAGRGEILTPLRDYTLPYTIVIAVPPVHVSTAWAFGQVTPHEEDRPDLVPAVRSNDLERWQRELTNDFERCVFQAWPVVEEAQKMLIRAGAGYAAITGTGSAVYGVFEDGEQAQIAVAEAESAGFAVWSG